MLATANEDYSLIRPLTSRLFCVPTTSTPVGTVFSQGEIIKRPHRAKIGDELLQTSLIVLALQWQLNEIK